MAAESVFVTAPDGIALHVRCYGRADGPALPVVCLPGLARTEADFQPLAEYLAFDVARPRRVLSLDYRGRGRSGYDSDWRNYNLGTELADVLLVLDALAVPRAVFVGTSRGGLLTMLLAATQPAMLAGAVLNDIGPVLDPDGLRRIKGYIGKVSQPRDVEDGVAILRRMFETQFPKLTPDEWLAWAHRSWDRTPEGLVLRYDPALAEPLKELDPDAPAAPLWPQFDALASVPLMIIRGALSDLLSVQTVAEMRARRPDLQVLTVADQGHAPLLAESPILAEIAAFVATCDRLTPAE